LLLALEALPDSSAEALMFLCHWLNAEKPGGLLADLRAQGMAEKLKAESLYQFARQALLHIEFTLPAQLPATSIYERLTDWLGFFASQDWSKLREEYAALLQRQQQVSSALQLARLDSEQCEIGLSEQGVTALKHILKQIGAVDNFSGCMATARA
jgi:predicted NACHT family NTPase